jgi:ketosteroid isomerase-like protein
MEAAEGIHESNERFVKAVREADIATMSSLYTSDATILPPNGDAVTGADEIARFWQGFFELGITEARPVTREVIPMGKYALEVGESTVYGQDGALVDRGKIMVLWKRTTTASRHRLRRRRGGLRVHGTARRRRAPRPVAAVSSRRRVLRHTELARQASAATGQHRVRGGRRRGSFGGASRRRTSAAA